MATDYTNLYREEIIGRFGEFIEQVLRDSIEEQDLLASGELYNSVNVYGDTSTGGLVVEFNDYGEVLNEGLSGFITRRDTRFIARGAGVRTGGRAGISSQGIVYIAFDDIVRWTRQRGIPEDAAGAIFYVLKRDGYEKKPWFDQALKAIELVAPDLLGAFITESVDELIETRLITTGLHSSQIRFRKDSDEAQEIRQAIRVALSTLNKR